MLKALFKLFVSVEIQDEIIAIFKTILIPEQSIT